MFSPNIEQLNCQYDLLNHELTDERPCKAGDTKGFQIIYVRNPICCVRNYVAGPRQTVGYQTRVSPVLARCFTNKQKFTI